MGRCGAAVVTSPESGSVSLSSSSMCPRTRASLAWARALASWTLNQVWSIEVSDAEERLAAGSGGCSSWSARWRSGRRSRRGRGRRWRGGEDPELFAEEEAGAGRRGAADAAGGPGHADRGGGEGGEALAEACPFLKRFQGQRTLGLAGDREARRGKGCRGGTRTRARMACRAARGNRGVIGALDEWGRGSAKVTWARRWCDLATCGATVMASVRWLDRNVRAACRADGCSMLNPTRLADRVQGGCPGGDARGHTPLPAGGLAVGRCPKEHVSKRTTCRMPPCQIVRRGFAGYEDQVQLQAGQAAEPCGICSPQARHWTGSSSAAGFSGGGFVLDESWGRRGCPRPLKKKKKKKKNRGAGQQDRPTPAIAEEAFEEFHGQRIRNVETDAFLVKPLASAVMDTAAAGPRHGQSLVQTIGGLLVGEAMGGTNWTAGSFRR